MLSRARSLRSGTRRNNDQKDYPNGSSPPTKAVSYISSTPRNVSDAQPPTSRNDVPGILQPNNLVHLRQSYEQEDARMYRSDALLPSPQLSAVMSQNQTVKSPSTSEMQTNEVLLPPAEVLSPFYTQKKGRNESLSPPQTAPPGDLRQGGKRPSASVVRSRSFKSYFHRMGRRKTQDSWGDAIPHMRTDSEEREQRTPPIEVLDEELSNVLMQGSRALERRQQAGIRSVSTPTQRLVKHQHSASAVGTACTSPRRRREQQAAQSPPYTFPLSQEPFPGAEQTSTPPSLVSNTGTVASSAHVSPNFSSAMERHTTQERVAEIKQVLDKGPRHSTHSPAPAIVLPEMERFASPTTVSIEQEHSTQPIRPTSTNTMRGATTLFHHVGAERELNYEHPYTFYAPEALRSQRASIESIAPGDLHSTPNEQ